MSSEAAGLAANIDAVLDLEGCDDTGVPHGAELLAFVDAVETGSSRGVSEEDRSACIAETSAALNAVVGPEAVVEAAGTIAAFNGLIRVADGTGIQLDDGLDAVSAETRERTGLNSYAGAANTPGAKQRSQRGNAASSDPKEIFSSR